MAAKKVLIVGADTLAGANIAATWRSRCQIVGACECSQSAFNGSDNLPASPSRNLNLRHLIAAERPHWVVVCGPLARSSWDWTAEFDRNEELRNIAAIKDAISGAGTKTIYVSTDALSTGPWIFSRERSSISHVVTTTNPVQSLENDMHDSDSLVIHTHLYGWSPTGQSYVEQLWRAVSDERPIIASGLRYGSPILASDFAELLWSVAHNDLTGVWNLAGSERASQWQFAVALATAGGYTLNHLSRLRTSKLSELPAPHETSLNSRLLQSTLKLPLPSLREGIGRFLEQSANGYRQTIAGFAEMQPVTCEAA